ncbi:hypothetical protein AAL09_12215 [Salmonella enterica subsp. enterica serovar Newport]|nr:hypothetical protein [Salmonella enterica subsp. enterica serovar Newport]
MCRPVNFITPAQLPEEEKLYKNQSDPAHTSELRDRMLAVVLPIWQCLFAVIVTVRCNKIWDESIN